MSAETLRRAAALMRERAEAATPGPWRSDVLGSEGYAVTGPQGTRRNGHRLAHPRVARCGYEDWDTDRDNAQHIASWHPAVALAVADLFDGIAADFTDDQDYSGGDYVGSALTAARAYLGEQT